MSYAIIRTGGKQFKVEPGKKYRVPTLEGEPGGKIEFTDILLGSDGKAVKGVDKKLAKAFHALTPGRRRGYVMHFSGAKKSETRTARIEKWAPKILAGLGMNDDD